MEPDARALTPAEALEAARRALAAVPDAAEGRFEADDFDDPVFSVKRDLFHLDADAMNDRLQAWIQREVRERLPGASAGVSYHHASPASHDPGDLDEEAMWHGVEPQLKLDVHASPVTARDVRAWAALVPGFLAVVAGNGRPEGYRPDVHVGGME